MSSFIPFFWISLFVVFYSYIGYGVIVYFLVECKKLLFRSRSMVDPSFEPSVALIVPAFNEEEFILLKIRNTLDLDYPSQKLTVIFITDGSTDATPRLLSEYPQFTLLHQPVRKGKLAAMNRAMQIVSEPIVIFCDANSLLNRGCIKEIVKHYGDPRVGGVAGEKRIYAADDNNAVYTGEGFYWKYESLIKKLDSDLYSVVGAAGELLSLRTALYEVIPENTIIEDFVLSLRVCLKGYIIRYEPAAYALEASSLSMADEQERKVRISAGGFQAIGMLKSLFNVFRYPVLSFQFISHRVLRWTVTPVCLMLVFIFNSLVVIYSGGVWYEIMLAGQIFFYLLALIGWLSVSGKVKNKLLQLPYYFVFMNLAVFLGLLRIISNTQTVIWKKASRKKIA